MHSKQMTMCIRCCGMHRIPIIVVGSKTHYLRSKRNFLFCLFINRWRHLLVFFLVVLFLSRACRRYIYNVLGTKLQTHPESRLRFSWLMDLLQPRRKYLRDHKYLILSSFVMIIVLFLNRISELVVTRNVFASLVTRITGT